MQQAVELAEQQQAQLTVAFTFSPNIIPESLGICEQDISNFIDSKEVERDKIVAQCSSLINVAKRSLLSDTYIDIVKLINEESYDLLIKPSEDEALAGKIFGTNDMGYLRQCPCPVWIVNANTEHQAIIVAAVDVQTHYPANELNVRNQLNIEVLKSANTLALFKNAMVHIVAAWSVEQESTLRNSPFFKKSEAELDTYINAVETTCRDNLTNLVNTAKESGTEMAPYELVLVQGQPREELPHYARSVDAELVVMGTVARVGIPGFIIGNTAESLLYRLNQAVFAIKPQGFESAIK